MNVPAFYLPAASARPTALAMIFALAVGASLIGCGGSTLVHLQVKDNLEDWRDDSESKHTTEVPRRVAEAPKAVVLIGTTDLALEGFGLVTKEPREPTLLASDEATKSMKQGVIFQTGGEAAREIIEWHLAKVWPAVSVGLSDHASKKSPQLVIRMANLGIAYGDGISVVVTLEATVPSGKKVSATSIPKGVHLGGHFAWILPVAIITGVIPALFWMRPTIQGFEQGAEERKFIEAVDAAAAELAVKLADPVLWEEDDQGSASAQR